MQKSYECELATHIGPESCGAAREGSVEALTGERAGRVFSCAPHHSLAAAAYSLSSLSPATHRRPHLRQEDGGIPIVRIRGGGYGRS